MANYNEQQVSGTSYTRAFSVVVSNGLNKKSIQFEEEDIFVLDDEQISRQLSGMVSEVFDDENAGTEIPLRNPVTGEPTSSTMTYQDIYVGLYSLYLKLALERDAQPDPELMPPVEPEPEQTVEPETEGN
jgi:hypothetical protein